MAVKATYFITADDDFIAANRAREIFEELSADVFDDMSKEIIDGTAGKVDEAVKACANTIESAATLSMFGGKKVIWLKGVNFISTTGAGKSESVKGALQKLLEFVENLDSQTANIVISAHPVDRRHPFFKKIKAVAECEDYKSEDPTSGCIDLIKRESKNKKIAISEDAIQTLVAIVAGNARMAISELEKLSVYVNGTREITEQDVIDMVPIFGEGDSRAITTAFYSGDLNSALGALKRYFFANRKASARPIITALQNQNALLIQIRALMDGGVFPKAFVRKDAIERAWEMYSHMFNDDSEKIAYNVFSQHPYYAGSILASIASKMSMKALIDIQMNLAKAFEDLITLSTTDEQVMRDFFVLSMSSSK